MAVDLSELMGPALPQKPRTPSRKQSQRTIVAPVEKTAVLAMLEQLERETAAQKQQMLVIAPDEDVSRWIGAITHWLRAVPTRRASFAHLCRSLRMPKIEVWLGVLLGEFELEQGEEFYSNTLWIKEASVGAE